VFQHDYSLECWLLSISEWRQCVVILRPHLKSWLLRISYQGSAKGPQRYLGWPRCRALSQWNVWCRALNIRKCALVQRWLCKSCCNWGLKPTTLTGIGKKARRHMGQRKMRVSLVSVVNIKRGTGVRNPLLSLWSAKSPQRHPCCPDVRSFNPTTHPFLYVNHRFLNLI